MLKPCPNPWCGSTETEIIDDGDHCWRYCVQCGLTGRCALTEDEADAAWNDRPSGWRPVSDDSHCGDIVLVWLPSPHDAEIEKGCVDEDGQWCMSVSGVVFDPPPTHWQPIEPPQ